MTTLAVVAQLELIPSVLMPDGYVPFGNDAFYHARRILDGAADPTAFYQFDPLIHYPAGSMITWPWGYDYAMAWLVRIGVALAPTIPPMTVLAYLPVMAVAVMTALLFWIALSLGLSRVETVILGCCVAVWPMTQSLYGVGQVDHHFAEHLFILAFVAVGLVWLRQPEWTFGALLSGIVLGMANAVHTGLFVLQGVWLIALLALWLRRLSLPLKQSAVFAAALWFSTLLVALPSESFQNLEWDFGYLSVLHVYVALITGLTTMALARFSPAGRDTLMLGGLVLVGSLPLLGDIVALLSFATRSESILQIVEEAKSTPQLWRDMGGKWVISVYTGLILLVPLIWLGSLLAAFRSNSRERIFFYIYVTLALPVMLVQFRFYYYGTLGLVLPLFLFASWLAGRWHATVARVVVCAVVVMATVPGFHYSFNVSQFPGGSAHYPLVHPLATALHTACATDPAPILAPSNEGHPLRFHADCPVIANNFLLTPQHFDAVRRANNLLALDPVALRAAEPEVGYVLAVAAAAMIFTPESVRFLPEEDARRAVPPLFEALLWADAEKPPEGYRLLDEVSGPVGYPLARLWKVERPSTQSPAS